MLASCALRMAPSVTFASIMIIAQGLSDELASLPGPTAGKAPQTSLPQSSLHYTNSCLTILDAFLLHAIHDPQAGASLLPQVKRIDGKLDTGLMRLLDHLLDSLYYNTSDLEYSTGRFMCAADGQQS